MVKVYSPHYSGMSGQIGKSAVHIVRKEEMTLLLALTDGILSMHYRKHAMAIMQKKHWLLDSMCS